MTKYKNPTWIQLQTPIERISHCGWENVRRNFRLASRILRNWAALCVVAYSSIERRFFFVRKIMAESVVEIAGEENGMDVLTKVR